MTKTVLGIDCGTQSTKVLVYEPDTRKILARAQAPHQLKSSDDGTREQEASEWLKALKKCLSSVGGETLGTVAAVGVSGQQHGFVPLDAADNVLCPVKLWCDTSTTEECSELTQAFGGTERLLSEVGNLILPGYTASKILWFRKHHSELYAKMSRILLPHDYLNFMLTGDAVMEYGDASGTGLLDVRNRCWSDRMLRLLDDARDLRGCLPPLVEVGRPAGFVSEQAAREFGLPRGILVSSGGGDNMMGAIGTGTNHPGCVTVSLGTSGTLYGYSDVPIVDPEGNLAAFCSSTGGWLPLLCTMNCTVATELIRGVLQADLTELEALARKAPAGSEGLVLLPFFNGERTPNLPRGRGCFMGMTATNLKRENIARSAMESGIYGLKLGLESFLKLGFVPHEIKLIGGGSRSPLWRQITADVFDLPVVCPVEEEAAAFGACLQAYCSLRNHEGKRTDLNDVLTEHVKMAGDGSHRPEQASTVLYRDAYLEYKRYVDAVRPLFN